jgi:hypothetical protein
MPTPRLAGSIIASRAEAEEAAAYNPDAFAKPP